MTEGKTKWLSARGKAYDMKEDILKKYLQEIATHLISTHGSALKWFDASSDIKKYRPNDQGWTVFEILEHISLTSFFLLKLIDKGANKVKRNTLNLNIEEVKGDFDYDLSKLTSIGAHKSFTWLRPEHMEPTSQVTEIEVANSITNQLTKCLQHLENLEGGQGLLNYTTMSVESLGKLNIYEYIYFLSQHASRHLSQMNENLVEYRKNK